MPSPGERIDESCRIAHEQHAPTGRRCAEPTHRQPVAAQVVEDRGVDVVLLDQAHQVLPQAGAFAAPAADADVRVIALREDPAVAAGNDPELDHRRPGDGVAVEIAVRDVRLEGDASNDARAEARLSRDDPVCPVGAHEHVRDDRLAVDARGHTRALVVYVRDPDSVPEVRAGAGGLLHEMEVEPAALRHEDEWLGVPPCEAPPVPEPDPEPVDDVLDYGIDRARRMSKRSAREPSAARLVARKARAVDKQDLRTVSREPEGRRRTGWAGADDERVEPLHRRIVDRRSTATIARRAGIPEWPKGAGCKPAGSAFGGSNPPPCTRACSDTVQSAPS